MYECLVGKLPFGEGETDPSVICEQIVPKRIKNKEERELIEQLLSRTPEARLGGSLPALQSHGWFRDVDWDLLCERKVEAPYKPFLENEEEASVGLPTLEMILESVYFQKHREDADNIL